MALPLQAGEHQEQPVALHDYAASNLQFIREAMERSGAFTGISGVATIGMGCIAILGAWVASWRLMHEWWLWTWFATATLGCLAGVAGMAIKARRTGTPVWAGPGKRFMFSFAPPIAAGIVMTDTLFLTAQDASMPVLWMLLYGAAIITGGAFTVRIVPLFGACFMLAGAALHSTRYYPALVMSAPVLGTMTVTDVALAAVFGTLHILFGIRVYIRYGG
jgi:hypothetical protein